MKKNRKNEEGAVLLLLIVMMSAVVLIVASLLRFNTQNIKFAAIEAEQEKALYLAEGVADAVDFYLMETLALPMLDGNLYNETADIRLILGTCNTTPNAAHMQWVSNIDPGDGTDDKNFFQLPSAETYLGESLINDITIKVYDPRDEDGPFDVTEENGSFYADVYVKVEANGTSRLIEIKLEIPPASELEDVSSLIKSKNLNYSNSL
jgi:hypothetical protein